MRKTSCVALADKCSCKCLGLTVILAGSDASQRIVKHQGVQSDIGVASYVQDVDCEEM